MKRCPRRMALLKASNTILTKDEQTDLLFKSIFGKAKRRGLENTLERKHIRALVLARDTCPQTGIPFDNRQGPQLPFRRSVDRIDNTFGYIPSNIQIVCNLYNQIKSIYPAETVEFMMREFVRYQDSLQDRVEEPKLDLDWAGFDHVNGLR